ncbi:hypothetical protein BJ165DRAFT_1521142 [Panaeolus papilionaceus]|nr:hypothetical protein BJ165DRAFT_1521142 [Panaeolus papilionaceus]
MPPLNLHRTASTLITLFGSVTNTILTIQVLAAWRSFKWEPESEWDSSPDNWQLNGIKFIWSLLVIYFASAAVVCAIGLHGVIKNKPTHIRLYRDYSIADLSFCALATAIATYAAFLSPARAGICEELSHHPELMRDMLEMGLNIENCERWLERAVFAGLAFMIVILFVRLHFLLAVSNYYSHLSKYQDQAYGLYPYNYIPYYPQIHHQRISPLPPSHISPPALPSNSQPQSQLPVPPTNLVAAHPAPATSYPMQRIYLVPNSLSSQPIDIEAATSVTSDDNSDDVVYAPIRRRDLPKDVRDGFLEAWVAAPTPNSTASTPRHSCDTAPVRHRRVHHHPQAPQASSHPTRRSESRSSRRSHRLRQTNENGVELELGAGQGRTGFIKLEIEPGEGLLRDQDNLQEPLLASPELPGYWDVTRNEAKR